MTLYFFRHFLRAAFVQIYFNPHSDNLTPYWTVLYKLHIIVAHLLAFRVQCKKPLFVHQKMPTPPPKNSVHQHMMQHTPGRRHDQPRVVHMAKRHGKKPDRTRRRHPQRQKDGTRLFVSVHSVRRHGGPQQGPHEKQGKHAECGRVSILVPDPVDGHVHKGRRG